MSSDIGRWIYQCDQCSQSKSSPGLGRSPLQQKRVSAPLEKIAIDIVGPCPKTNDGNEYMIVISDYFTKWVEAYATPDHTALTVADKLCTEFIARFGCPVQIHTDQGREFESELFQQMCKILDIDKTRCTPYRPNSDGLVERFNKTLQQMLKVFVNKQRNDWDDYLPYVLMAYRSTFQESTKCSPNLMMLGREIALPLDLMVGDPPNTSENFCPVEYVEWLKHSMGTVFNFANENLHHSAKRQKRYYDRNIKHREYIPGDFVWRWYPPSAGIKLGLGWTGPFRVARKCSDVTYMIEKSPDSNLITVHVDHLKPYTGENTPGAWDQSSLDVISPEGSLPQTSDVSPDSSHVVENHSSILSDHGDTGGSTGGSTGGDLSSEGVPLTSTPLRTRCGREVKKPKIYSP